MSAPTAVELRQAADIIERLAEANCESWAGNIARPAGWSAARVAFSAGLLRSTAESSRKEIDHHIKLTLQRNGYGVSAKFTCTAGPDADCRNHCKECDPEYGCSEYAEHRASWVPSGHCNPTEWISNDEADWVELYGGTADTEPHSGPITLKWEGDYYSWDYADTSPADDTPEAEQ